MCLDRLNFLTKFDKFYQELISLAREDKINEPEFYIIITSKAKAMDRRRLVIKITEKRENNHWAKTFSFKRRVYSKVQ